MGLTREPEHARCDACRHQDARTYAVPICRIADMPQACVLAWERCDGKHWEAKR